MQEMALPCKSKVLLKFHEYDSNEIVEFSSLSLILITYIPHPQISTGLVFKKHHLQMLNQLQTLQTLAIPLTLVMIIEF